MKESQSIDVKAVKYIKEIEPGNWMRIAILTFNLHIHAEALSSLMASLKNQLKRITVSVEHVTVAGGIGETIPYTLILLISVLW